MIGDSAVTAIWSGGRFLLASCAIWPLSIKLLPSQYIQWHDAHQIFCGLVSQLYIVDDYPTIANLESRYVVSADVPAISF